MHWHLITYYFSVNSFLLMQIPSFDWQGHRGARGLMPENTIPAFLHALEYPAIRTLELDVVISKDSLVVVSHEPWLSPVICAVDGAALNLFQMTYEEIRQFDCGLKKHPRFPQQAKIGVYKPTLAEVVGEVDRYCQLQGRPLPRFNIELKAQPEWDDTFTPSPPAFARLVLKEIQDLGIVSRTTLQSFDPRILRELHRTDPALTLSYLVEKSFEFGQLATQLGFEPAILSPGHRLVNAEMIREAKQRGMKVIPWTVNQPSRMKRLMEMGVDGIITDYPDRIPAYE